MASGDIALQRSGFVEKEELYNNEDGGKRGASGGQRKHSSSSWESGQILK